jgi:hypothetical protein
LLGSRAEQRTLDGALRGRAHGHDAILATAPDRSRRSFVAQRAIRARAA